MSCRAFNVKIPGVPVPLAPTQAVTYLAGQNLSPQEIVRRLKGQMTYGAVRSAMSRARKNGETIPLWIGGYSWRPGRMRA